MWIWALALIFNILARVLEMILKLVEHSEKHQIKIHISIGIYGENVNLGFGSHFQCFG